MPLEQPKSLVRQELTVTNVFDDNTTETQQITAPLQDTPCLLMSVNGEIRFQSAEEIFALDTITESNVVEAVQKIVTLLKA